MLWLGAHFPLLPLEVFNAGRTPRGDAAAPQSDAAPACPEVVADRHARVVLGNREALEAGIVPGCTLATAHSIVPALVHYRRDPGREQQRLALLAEALYAFSARVSLAPPTGVMLEIGASLRLFGDAAALAHRAAATCHDLGHDVLVGWAPTPLAALTLARADVAGIDEAPLSAAAIEPDHLTDVHIERFANMGVHTLGQLLALPRREVARRFGGGLGDYLARLTGDRPDPRPAIRPAERFRSTLHLLEPLNGKEALAFPMERLLTDLQHWLVARQLGAERLCWCFAPSGGEARAVRLPVRFSTPRQRRDDFLEVTRLGLAEAELPADVVSLTLEAHRLGPWSPASGGLFRHQPAAADHGTIGALVDQLRARLGRNACYHLTVQDQHTPERAWAHSASPTPARPSVPDAMAGHRRPLWLFDPPRPMRRDRLTLIEGPERIHTGWWLDGAGAGEARDYYVARHSSGAECWVFVDPAERWFLHGYF
jgi:protein ImuB